MTPFFQLVGVHCFLFLMLWLSILAARSLHRSLFLQGRRVALRSSGSLLRSRGGSLPRPPAQDAASMA